MFNECNKKFLSVSIFVFFISEKKFVEQFNHFRQSHLESKGLMSNSAYQQQLVGRWIGFSTHWFHHFPSNPSTPYLDIESQQHSGSTGSNSAITSNQIKDSNPKIIIIDRGDRHCGFFFQFALAFIADRRDSEKFAGCHTRKDPNERMPGKITPIK